MSTDLAVVSVPAELLDVRTGEIVEATPAKAAELRAAGKDLIARVQGLLRDCDAVLLEESKRLGTKTLHLDGHTATISGGQDLAWNLDILLELRNRGLPEARYNELVVATVTYKVNAAVAKQLEASNPAYAEVIQMARSYEPRPWRVNVK